MLLVAGMEEGHTGVKWRLEGNQKNARTTGGVTEQLCASQA